MHSIFAALSAVASRAQLALLMLFLPPPTAARRQTIRSVADRGRGDGGQATAEYALVLLGAAAVALLLVAWATNSGKVDDLLNGVIDKILDQV